MKSIQPALTSYFFGQEKDQKLTVEKFIQFQKRLQEEILRIEFHRYDLNPDGTLKEVIMGPCPLWSVQPPLPPSFFSQCTAVILPVQLGLFFS